MNVNYISLIFLAGIISTNGFSQTKQAPPPPGAYEILPAYQPWLETGNAAGLSAYSFPSAGKTFIGTSQESGSFRRPQEAEQINRLYFQSEKYQRMKNSVIYGGFKFTQQWDKNLEFTDVLDPYRGTPYIIGDSIGGNWKKQLYELSLKAATLKLANDKISLGVGLDYKVGSGARHNDPRPLNSSNELSLAPSLIWHLNARNRIGVNGSYRSYKEEVEIEVSSNGGFNYPVYKFMGPGIYMSNIIPASSSFTRNYKAQGFGGALQYDREGGSWKWLSEAGIFRNQEDVTDGISTPIKAGKLKETIYHIQTAFIYQPRKLVHRLKFNWKQYDREGQEFFTIRESNDKFESIFSPVLTTALVTESGLKYEIIRPDGENNFISLLYAGAGFSGLDNKYLFPRSRQIADRTQFAIGAKRNWKAGKSNSFLAGFDLGYNSRLSESTDNINMPNTTNFAAEHVFYPDHGYLISDAWNANLMLQYAFRLSNVREASFFIRANGLIRQQTGKEFYGVTGSRTQFSITLGAFH